MPMERRCTLVEIRGYGVISPPDTHTAGCREGRHVWGFFLVDVAPVGIVGLSHQISSLLCCRWTLRPPCK